MNELKTTEHPHGTVETLLVDNEQSTPLETQNRNEREWRDSELLRTDSLVDLSDYPRNKTTEEFKAYRQSVADWDSNPNFPNCELRPVWEDKL